MEELGTLVATKVLIVDDDRTIREVLRAMLGYEGCVVVDVPDGESALAVADEIDPDVVLLDLTMPGMDGLDVCRRLKARPDPPKVVVITARDTAADELRGRAAGADAFLRKPFSPLAVLDVVGVEAGGG